MQSKKERLSFFTFPLLLFCLFLILSLLLINKSLMMRFYVPFWDEAHHLAWGYLYFQKIFYEDFSSFIAFFLDSGHMYPPLYHLAIAFSYLLTGISPIAGIITNLPFLFILIFSTYKLGKFFGDRKAAFVAAFLTPILPIFLRLQEQVLIDLASISLFILSFYLLFKTEYLQNRKYSILFGISILINLLTKWPFVAPALTFLIYFFESYKRAKQKKVIIFNLIMVFLISSLVFIWYANHYQYIIQTMHFFSSPDNFPQKIWNNPYGFNLRNIFYYFTLAIGNNGIGLIPFIYGFLALVFYRPKMKNYHVYFLGSIIVSYLILTAMRDKESKYIAYIYPLVMIITTSWIFSFKRKLTKLVNLSVFIFSITLSFLLSQWSFLSQATTLNIKLDNKLLINFFPFYSTKFYKDFWPTEQILVENYSETKIFGSSSIKTESEKRKKILILTDHRFFNPANFKFYIFIHKIPLNINYYFEIYNPVKPESLNLTLLGNYDYIFTKSGESGGFANSEATRKINDFLASSKDFRLKKSYETPDGTLAMIYEVVKDNH